MRQLQSYNRIVTQSVTELPTEKLKNLGIFHFSPPKHDRGLTYVAFSQCSDAIKVFFHVFFYMFDSFTDTPLDPHFR